MNNRPDWFSFENCWKNLVETKEDCRLTVVHDGLLDREYEGADSVINIDAHEVLPVLLSEWEQGDETYIALSIALSKYTFPLGSFRTTSKTSPVIDTFTSNIALILLSMFGG